MVSPRTIACMGLIVAILALGSGAAPVGADHLVTLTDGIVDSRCENHTCTTIRLDDDAGSMPAGNSVNRLDTVSGTGNAGLGLPDRLTWGSHTVCVEDLVGPGCLDGGDAETLDGLDSLQFLRSDSSGTLTGDLAVTGRLGIGTASPAELLHVFGASPTILLEDSGTNTLGAKLLVDGGDDGNFKLQSEAPAGTFTTRVTVDRDTGNTLLQVPAAKGGLGSNQVISNNAWTVLDLGAAEWDTDSIADGANDRYVIKTAGKYRISTSIDWNPNAAGLRWMHFFKNGDATSEEMAINPVNGAATIHQGFTEKNLAVNDYIQIKVKQTSGGDLGLQGSTSSFLSVTRIA